MDASDDDEDDDYYEDDDDESFVHKGFEDYDDDEAIVCTTML